MRRTKATGAGQVTAHVVASPSRGPAAPVASLLVRAGASLRRRMFAGAFAVLSLGLAASGVLTTAAPAQAEITNGLVLRYKMDETSGTVAADSSGNGRNGTVNGTASWSGAEGLAFNGSNTYIKVPNNIMSGLSSITVAFDVWIDPAIGKPYFLYGFGNTSGTSGNGYLFATGNQFRTAITTTNYAAEQNTRPSTSYQLARGMWKHVTYTQTGNTGILYENGVEKARNTNVTIAPGAIGGGTTTADYIGRSLYSSDLYFNGRMRDFRVYDRALSTSEVQAVATGTEEQWEELQALAAYNGALGAFDDPDVGPVVIFPSDYTGDINDLQAPPDWTNEFGQAPAEWPDPVSGWSQLFTLSQITDLQDAVTAQVQPNGDTTYQLSVYYDVSRDQVVVATDAPASVTDPLVAAHPGKLVIEAYTLDNPPPAKCTPDQTTVGKVLSDGAAPAAGFNDATTKLQWQQVQALADYNCALAAFDDPNIGPVLIFPSDYTGDIDDLQKPPGWTSEYGEVPAAWPTPTTVKSPQFTLAQITDIQDAVIRQVSADGDTTAYSVAVRYDGMSDRVVVDTDAPSSVTAPLLTAYPNRVVINTVTAPTPASTADSSSVVG
ncbi:LamG domain-containing protein [Streptomyces sp. GbtcB7]|uniref:LamG domain-containing protein n=1 Tax=Streptomyces sp. GbtcB7 TaxID=2824752 RepID=UPI0027E46F7A|nr:LamG domain-containing protein [Streptomyces sp. GbtcB7]